MLPLHQATLGGFMTVAPAKYYINTSSISEAPPPYTAIVYSLFEYDLYVVDGAIALFLVLHTQGHGLQNGSYDIEIYSVQS